MPKASDLKAHNQHLWIHCESRDCLHRAEYAPEALFALVGDIKMAELRKRLRYDQCGGKDVSISSARQGPGYEEMQGLK